MASSTDPVPFVRVVTLDFDGGDLVVDCVRSLVATDWPADRLEVVCVDNASSDGSVERIEREFPHVVVLRNGVNLGFPGNNRALRDLDGIDLVALVNSDAVVEPGWLRPLVERITSEPGIGAVCPKILFADRFVEVPIVAGPSGVGRPRFPLRLRGASVGGIDVFRRLHVAAGGGRSADRDGTFEWCGAGSVVRVPVPVHRASDTSVEVVLDIETIEPVDLRVGIDGIVLACAEGERRDVPARSTPTGVDVINDIGSWVDDDWVGHERGLFDVDSGRFDSVDEVGTWCGAGVLLRAEYLEDVGLFEESFFLYYEDTDLAVRGRGRGWRYVTEPRSIVRHVHSASTVEGSAMSLHHIERNRLLSMVRNAPGRTVVRAFLRHPLVTMSYARSSVTTAVRTRRTPDTTMVRRRSRAYVDALRLLPGALRSRRAIASHRLVDRGELARRVGLGAVEPGTEAA